MITIKEYNNRFPKLNDKYFNSLSDDEKIIYLNRTEVYHNALLDMLIKTLNLEKIENSLDNSSNEFKPVDDEQKDMYQNLAKDKLKYIYLRNNLYVERLSKSQLQVLDNNEKENTYSLVQETFREIIDDYPDKQMITNYGPDSDKYYSKSSNIILGVRIDDDYYPDDKKSVDLLFQRNNELDFLKQFLETKIRQKCEIDGTVIRYTKNSVKTLSNEEETTNSITK